VVVAAEVAHNVLRFERTSFGLVYDLAVLKTVFNFVLGPGEGPYYHFPKGIGSLGPIAARIRWDSLFLIFILAISAARMIIPWGCCRLRFST
jgi:hypothetical protein